MSIRGSAGKMSELFMLPEFMLSFKDDQSELMNSHLLFLVAAVIVKVSL